MESSEKLSMTWTESEGRGMRPCSSGSAEKKSASPDHVANDLLDERDTGQVGGYTTPHAGTDAKGEVSRVGIIQGRTRTKATGKLYRTEFLCYVWHLLWRWGAAAILVCNWIETWI